MAKISNFNVDLNNFSKKLNINLSQVIRKVSLDIWNGVTRRTPVDTGRARASWNLSEEFVNLSTAPETTSNPNAVGKRGLITGKGKTVWVTNNVDYIEFLENGSSKQAPTGMVNITLAEAAAKIRSYR